MMNRKLLAALLVVFASSAPAGAQGIGGLIKKKAADAVKGKDKPKEEAASGEIKSKMPFVVTDAVMQSFEKGLEVEIAKRAEVVKFLASVPTQEKYLGCRNEVMMSPEGQKISLQMASLPENVSTEQMQKTMQKIAGELEVLTTKKCGEDPSKYNAQWRTDQLQKAKLAGATRFGTVFKTNGGGDPNDFGPFLPSESAPDAGRLWPLGQSPESPSDDQILDWYNLLGEWPPPFCGLSKEDQESAAKNGLSVHPAGQAKYVAYVYAASEASVLLTHCPTTMGLLSKLS